VGVVLLASTATARELVCVETRGPSRDIVVRDGRCRANETKLGSFAALQKLLAALEVADDGSTLRLSGVNLQVVSGSGATDGPTNGTGNVIVGYNDLDEASRAGSHNLVVGSRNAYTSYGGLVTGRDNEVAGPFAAILAGRSSSALGESAVVAGGRSNEVRGEGAVCVGGADGSASGRGAVVVGGDSNSANGALAVVSGGRGNDAPAASSAVGGGFQNLARGELSVVSGGVNRTASGEGEWVAGSLSQPD
jgi:hypothetical protein